MFPFEQDEFPATVSANKKIVPIVIPCLSFGSVFSSSHSFAVMTDLILPSPSKILRKAGRRQEETVHTGKIPDATHGLPQIPGSTVRVSKEISVRRPFLLKETERQAKKAKEGGGKGVVVPIRNVKQSGSASLKCGAAECQYDDSEQHQFNETPKKSVPLEPEALQSAKITVTNPSLGVTQPTYLNERGPQAPEFEDQGSCSG